MKCFSLSCIRPDFQLEISGRETESDQFYLCFLLLFLLYLVGWCFGSYVSKARKLKEEEVRLTDKNWNQVLESCGHDALQFRILWWGSCHFPFASFALSSSWFPEVSFYFRGILIPRCYSKEETLSGDKPFAVMATSAFLEASAVFRILVPFSTQALLSAVSKSGSLATPSYH